jgi:hypothetical protein
MVMEDVTLKLAREWKVGQVGKDNFPQAKPTAMRQRSMIAWQNAWDDRGEPLPGRVRRCGVSRIVPRQERQRPLGATSFGPRRGVRFWTPRSFEIVDADLAVYDSGDTAGRDT